MVSLILIRLMWMNMNITRYVTIIVMLIYAHFLQVSQQNCLKSTNSKTCLKQNQGLWVRASLGYVLEQDTLILA